MDLTHTPHLSTFLIVVFRMEDSEFVKAAVIIQKIWRGYKERVRTKSYFKKAKKRVFIAKETLETEEIYVRSLKLLETVFFMFLIIISLYI
jgi:hypothetical protein